MAGIGTKNESSLHKTLKFQYAGPGGFTEAEVGEFVADGIRADGEYIEVQTGSFAPLRKKIKALTRSKKAKIRIIHPIAVNKYIEVYENNKTQSARSYAKDKLKKTSASSAAKNLTLLYRRKSPKKGSLWSLFDALVHAPEIALMRGVTIEAVLADITEIRVNDGKGSWRRKGVSVKDRVLSAYRESVVFRNAKDYARHFALYKKGEEFTASCLAFRAAVNIEDARQALYTLSKMGVVARKGKKGRAWVYCVKNN